MADAGDCSICLQNLLHPAQLPCGHVFCFLCIKGCALYKRRCPMCRMRFSVRFFDDPKLINAWDCVSSINCPEEHVTNRAERPETSVSVPRANSDSLSSDYVWFYEGYGGWWQYDERTCREIEESYSKQLLSCEVTIAGYIYIIDLTNMTQVRKDRSGRRRRIKRDLSTCEKKGIAGIKITNIPPAQPSSQDPKSPNDHSVAAQPTNADALAYQSPNSSDGVDHLVAACSAIDLRGRSRTTRQSRNAPNPDPGQLQLQRSVSSSQSPTQSNHVVSVPQPRRQNRRLTCRSLTRQV